MQNATVTGSRLLLLRRLSIATRNRETSSNRKSTDSHEIQYFMSNHNKSRLHYYKNVTVRYRYSPLAFLPIFFPKLGNKTLSLAPRPLFTARTDRCFITKTRIANHKREICGYDISHGSLITPNSWPCPCARFCSRWIRCLYCCKDSNYLQKQV